MNRILATTILTLGAVAATPSGAQAQQGGMAMGTMPHGTTKTITGTVIDVSCKFGQGLAGKEHKMCSEICADKGLPLAVLGDDGTLYLATSPGMPGDGQNPKLKPYAEQKVTVSGKVFAAAGASAIQIEKIVAAK